MAQGSSAEKGLAMQQGLNSSTLVVRMVLEVTRAKPDCQHMAQYVIGRCEECPSCLPWASECLRSQPERGLMLLYCKLQVEEHNTQKMAALAAAKEAAARLASLEAELKKLKEGSVAQAAAVVAAEAAAAQLASTQTEVERLEEQNAAQAVALQAAEAAAAQIRQACLQERDDVVKQTQRRFEEQVNQIKAEASNSGAQALAAARQRGAQLERELAAEQQRGAQLGRELAAEQQRGARLKRELAHIKDERAEERSAANHKALPAAQQDTISQVVNTMQDLAWKLQGGGESTRTAQFRKRHREDDKALRARQKEASATEDKVTRKQSPGAASSLTKKFRAK
ncbi:hypothetical protein DUNSADRAFT_1120 [Dunaliella salina]|uniref:Uncharacterized protein n=1 Tax=Dunaliella salina TaxID=3046 RepID=A0ABQ7FXZ0_DUNSA|nr:hypothetical protein DUNSADRAFT_1120 [Dunaliella salina]|eukprot:KAF5827219.1 hypothetical protein DUNSADRAFT_1120 [Dunaliella salina]